MYLWKSWAQPLMSLHLYLKYNTQNWTASLWIVSFTTGPCIKPKAHWLNKVITCVRWLDFSNLFSQRWSFALMERRTLNWGTWRKKTWTPALFSPPPSSTRSWGTMPLVKGWYKTDWLVEVAALTGFFLLRVTVSVLSIEGTDCRLDELGRLADRTGGKVSQLKLFFQSGSFHLFVFLSFFWIWSFRWW